MAGRIMARVMLERWPSVTQEGGKKAEIIVDKNKKKKKTKTHIGQRAGEKPHQNGRKIDRSRPAMQGGGCLVGTNCVKR